MSWCHHCWIIRQSCSCRVHDNAQFLSDKLCQRKLILPNLRNVEGLDDSMCCTVTNNACVYRECEICCNRTTQIPETDLAVVLVKQKGHVVQQADKSCVDGTVEDLVNQLNESFNSRVCRHIFVLFFTYFFEHDQATERLVVMDPSTNTGIGRTFTFFLPSHLAVVFVALVGISGNLGTQSWSSREKTSRLACCRMPDSCLKKCPRLHLWSGAKR